LVRRIEPAGWPGLYEPRVDDNRHHVVYRRCDASADADCAVGDTPCPSASVESGSEIHEAEVMYWRRCPACVAATSVSLSGLEACDTSWGTRPWIQSNQGN